MRLFRYQMTFIDGTNEYGMCFGVDEKDVSDYLMPEYFGVKRIHVFQCDDITWPSPAECPMGE